MIRTLFWEAHTHQHNCRHLFTAGGKYGGHFLFLLLRCLTDAKLTGGRSYFRDRTRDDALQFQLQVFKFPWDPRTAVIKSRWRNKVSGIKFSFSLFPSPWVVWTRPQEVLSHWFGCGSAHLVRLWINLLPDELRFWSLSRSLTQIPLFIFWF